MSNVLSTPKDTQIEKDKRHRSCTPTTRSKSKVQVIMVTSELGSTEGEKEEENNKIKNLKK